MRNFVPFQTTDWSNLLSPGEVTTELKDGRQFTLKKGMSFQLSDDISAHRSFTTTGAKLFIVDGGFLQVEKTKFQRGIWM